MFRTILGIPAHPLLVHTAVVFVPLLAVGAIAYVVWPRVHDRITWAVVALAVIAPSTAFFSKESGEAFRNRLIERHQTSGANLDQIDAHQAYGDATFRWTLGLGVVTLAAVYLVRRYRGSSPNLIVTIGTAVVVIAVAVGTGYYIFRTGDTGAHVVWQGR